MSQGYKKRAVTAGVAVLGAAVLLAGCSPQPAPNQSATNQTAPNPAVSNKPAVGQPAQEPPLPDRAAAQAAIAALDQEMSAVEDQMRELQREFNRLRATQTPDAAAWEAFSKQWNDRRNQLNLSIKKVQTPPGDLALARIYVESAIKWMFPAWARYNFVMLGKAQEVDPKPGQALQKEMAEARRLMQSVAKAVGL